MSRLRVIPRRDLPGRQLRDALVAPRRESGGLRGGEFGGGEEGAQDGGGVVAAAGAEDAGQFAADAVAAGAVAAAVADRVGDEAEAPHPELQEDLVAGPERVLQRDADAGRRAVDQPAVLGPFYRTIDAQGPLERGARLAALIRAMAG